MDPDLHSPSWEQQPGESTRWYARFERYRLAGPNRSLLGAVNAERQQRGQVKSRSVPQAWAKASQRWQWRQRAAAWDTQQRHEARAAHAQEIEEMNRRHVQEARALQSKGIQGLKALDGAELAPADVLRFCVQASQLERTILGVPSSPGEDQPATDPGCDTVPFSVEDAVRADQELEQWNHEHLPAPAHPPLPHRDPQMP